MSCTVYDIIGKTIFTFYITAFIIVSAIAQDTLIVERIHLPEAVSITNVSYYSLDDQLVIITYDLLAQSYSVPVNVVVNVVESVNPYREVRVYSLIGDAGENVIPGRNKKIYWWMPGDFTTKIFDDLHGINLSIEPVETVEQERSYPPAFLEMGWGDWTRVLANGQLVTTIIPIRVNFSFPLFNLNLFELRIGIFIFRYNTEFKGIGLLDENLLQKRGIIEQKNIYGIRGGFGIRAGPIRLTADIEQPFPGDDRPHELMAFNFFTTLMHIRISDSIHIAGGVTFFRKRHLYASREGDYTKNTSGNVYYPSFSLSFRI